MNDVHDIVLSILSKRNIVDEEEIEEFLSDKPKKTYDPLLLPDMDAAVDRIISAIDENRKICIYGDYDVDGISSIVILYQLLTEMTENLTYFIPSRFDEGYGLNEKAIEELKKQKVEMIITVDCGSVSVDEVEKAKELGIEIIVTDHHSVDENRLPDCLLINPLVPNSAYPFHGLCGCGVAFKLIQAITKKKGLDRSNVVKPLDMVAIATVADVVPLIDENRTLVKYGMKELHKGKRRALKKLYEKIDIDEREIDTYKIGYIIAPHMNAAGRMDHAKSVVEYFLEKDEKKLDQMADQLVAYNDDRRRIQDACLDEGLNEVESKRKDDLFLLLNPKNIHEGIAGIVSGRIKDKYYKPTITLSESENTSEGRLLKGSGRSIEGVNMIDLLVKYKPMFTKLGGHAMAAGFTIPEKNLEKLREAMNNEMEQLLSETGNLLERKIVADEEIDSHEATIELAGDLNALAPFGTGNPRPKLIIRNAQISDIHYLGKDDCHVKFRANGVDSILFSSARDYDHILMTGKNADIIGTLEINSWNNRKKPQFKVIHLTEVEYV